MNLTPKYERVPNVDKFETFPLPSFVKVQHDLRLKMRDGIEISLNIFRPEATAPTPVILACTRYGKDESPNDYLPEYSRVRRAIGTGFGSVSISEATPFEAPDPAYWVKHGYTVIHADARGTGKSDGQCIDSYSQEIVEDFCEVVEWAARQSWSTGSVGLAGVSYLATIQYLIAGAAPMGLECICPWEGQSDRYRHLFFPGGIPETGFVPWLAGGMTQIPGSDDPPEFGASNSPLITQVDLLKANLSAIKVPMLVCASWSDQGLHTVGSLAAFVEASSENKWLYTHGGEKWTVFHSDQANEYQRHFFDRFLKKSGDAMQDMPRVRLEIRKSLEESTIRHEAEWPLKSVEPTRWFLNASDHSLDLSSPERQGSLSYDSQRPEYLHFSTQFDFDTELIGPMKLHLLISTDDGDDLDIFTGIRKFDATGNEVHFGARENDRKGIVASGMLRASHRKLDVARSTELQPYLAHDEYCEVRPNEIYALDIAILPAATVFEKGSSLVLTIAARDIWSNRLCQHRSLRSQGRHTIYTGGNHASYLLVPVNRR
jgi:predicted acyl esterase